MLTAYRRKKTELEAIVADLLRQRDAVATIIKGLELLVGDSARPLQHEAPHSDPLLNAVTRSMHAKWSEESDATALELGLMVLIERGQAMSAAEIAEWLSVHGRPANYQTLYKALRREAERPNARIAKSGERFVAKPQHGTTANLTPPRGRGGGA
jgi:hypothetical protein